LGVTENASRPTWAKWLRVGLPAGLFALALLIRLFGIGWGLKNELHNQSYHPDEPVIFAYSQAIEPASLDFTPGFYNYGTLYLTVLRVASDVTAAYTGAADPRDPASVWAFVSRAHLSGRIVSAMAGAATVLLVFLMLRRFIGSVGAGAAAMAIALAPGHVMHSRFQTVDVLAVFFLAASAFYALRLIPHGDEDVPDRSAIKWVLLSGLMTGLSAGTKYTGLLGLLTLFVVLAVARRKTALRDAALGLVACLAAFLIATPGALLEPEKFRENFVYEMQHTATGHGLVFEGTSSGFLYHLGNLGTGFTLLLTLLGLGGLIVAALRKERWALALLAFFLAYYALIGRAEVKFLRYTFPLYIGLAAGFGYLIAEGQRRQGTGRFAVAGGIFALGWAATTTAGVTGRMMAEDPRDGAAAFLKANSASGTAVGLPSPPWYYTPPLYPDTARGMISYDQRLAGLAAATNPAAVYYRAPDATAHDFDARLVTEAGPRYIVFSTLETDYRERLLATKGLQGPSAAASQQYEAFMRALSENYQMVKQFGTRAGSGSDVVEDYQYVQPVVMVWERKAQR